jgi:hypothetical protein
MRRSLWGVAFVASAVLASVVAACGKSEPGRTPSGGKISCTSDADCRVVNHTSCCTCCDGVAVAIPKEEEARIEGKCATVDCQACSASIACPKVEPVSAFVARCTEGTCAAVHN